MGVSTRFEDEQTAAGTIALRPSPSVLLPILGPEFGRDFLLASALFRAVVVQLQQEIVHCARELFLGFVNLLSDLSSPRLVCDTHYMNTHSIGFRGNALSPSRWS